MLALLHTVVARIRGLFGQRALDADFDEELDAHLAMAEEQKVQQGMTPEQARRAARVELGGLTQLREAGRAARGMAWLSAFELDVRLGLRMLRKSWGLTLIGGLALTTAISITVGLFNTIQAITGATLPLDESDRVVALMVWDAGAQTTRGVPGRDVERWRQSVQSVVSLGAFRTVQRTLALNDRAPETVAVAEMTASGFDVARVAPLLGRPIRVEDERAGADPVVVIGHDVWESRFSLDPQVIGRTVRLDDVFHTVIGVMPDDFAFPVNHRFWIPLRITAEDDSPPAPVVAFGRLAPGATLQGADAEVATIGLLPTPTPPEDDERLSVQVVRYAPGVMGNRGFTSFVVWMFLIIGGLLVLPPCANIAILIYARTVARHSEFAARYALGATRARIVGQLCLETLLLVAGATGLALVIVSRVGDYLETRVRLPNGNPFWLDLGAIPMETMLVAIGLAAVATVIVGLVPAVQATARVMDVAVLGGRSSMRLGTAWTVMVAAQVALSIAVLPVAAELAWGTIRPVALGPGFAAERFLTAQLTLADATLPPAASRPRGDRLQALGDELTRRLRNLPEVAALTRSAAVPGTEPVAVVELHDGSDAARAENPPQVQVRVNAVDDAFFATFDLRFLSGRPFDDARGGAQQVVVINQTLAARLVGVDNPVGRLIRYRSTSSRPADPDSWHEIVGVVNDLHANDGRGLVYHPLPTTQHPLGLSLRVTSGLPQVAQRLPGLVTDIDGNLHAENVRSLAEVYRDNGRAVYLAGLMVGTGTLSVLLLAAAGIYAFMSFTVTRRRREIGIRSALGARSTRLLMGILGQASKQLGLGAAGGVLLALWLRASLPLDPIGGAEVPGMVPAAVGIMVVLGLLAAAGPARRALRVNPTEALRDG